MAGTSSLKNYPELLGQCKYFLESYISIKSWQIPYMKKTDFFLVDSGAFTFMNGKRTTNLHQYAEKYAYFIKEHDIKYFFELDVESVVGWEEYMRLNDTITKITKKQSIPVFHKNRGIDWFKKACQKHNYVAFGGVAVNAGHTKKIVRDVMPSFIRIAHDNKAIIHGLGFTSTTEFERIKFDSVDSTTWTMGGRMGNLCYFTGTQMKQYYPSKHGKKPKNCEDINAHNFLEWLKFQKYADENL